jgi:hypothetical protein
MSSIARHGFAWVSRAVALLILVLLVSTAGRLVIGAPSSPGDETATRSDKFWELLTRKGHYALDYDSIGEIAADVHLVVRGRITDIRTSSFRYFERRVGETSDDPNEDPLVPILTAIVRVDEVLKGTPSMREPGTIEVSLDVPWPHWEDVLLPNIPTEDHVFFLMNDAQQRAESGYPEDDPKTSPFLYWRPNGDQAVLRFNAGRVDVIEPILGRYPSDLAGAPYWQVAQAVEATAD